MLKTILLTGCSAIGKTTLAKILVSNYSKLSLVTSFTTREKREEDINYKHISVEEFKEGIHIGEFADYNEVYKNTFYGTKWETLQELTDSGKIPLLVTDKYGAKNYNNITNCLVINLIPRDIELIRQRILLVRNDRLEERLKTLEDLHLGFGNEFEFINIVEVMDSILLLINNFIG